MMVYLAKFIACSGLLLAVYHLLLKNKAMYRFNRIFLLAGIVFSLAVPFIQFEQHVVDLPQVMPVQEAAVEPPVQTVVATESYVEAAPEANSNSVAVESPVAVRPTVVAPVAAKPVNYLLIIGLSIYSLVTGLLLYRFIKNLFAIRRMAATNPNIDYYDAELVLIPQRLTPHSFFKYIFLNGDEYLQKKIEEKILHHELAHTRQYHSADVVFTELVQVFCWFNPLLILYRKSIQLNHEFLADEAVLNNDDDVSGYQYMLLSSLSAASGLSMTSQFSYALTKKRLLMMTRKTSFTTSVISRLVTLVFVGIVFVVFCNATVSKREAIVKTDKLKTKKHDKFHNIARKCISLPYAHTERGVSEAVLNEYAAIVAKYPRVRFDDHHISETDREKLIGIYKQMSIVQQQQQILGFCYGGLPLHVFDISATKLEAYQYKPLYNIYINGSPVSNEELAACKPEDLKLLSPITFENSSKKFKVLLCTNEVYDAYLDDVAAKCGETRMMFWTHHFGKAESIPTIVPFKAQYAGMTRYNIDTTAVNQLIHFQRDLDRLHYEHTEKGVAQALLDEYHAIALKNGFKPGMMAKKWFDMIGSPAELRMIAIYKQMSSEQQAHEAVGFAYFNTPTPGYAITEAQFRAYKDKHIYLTYVVDDEGQHTDLEKYKTEDLKKISFEKLEGEKWKYKVMLETNKTFYDRNKEEAARKGQSALIFKNLSDTALTLHPPKQISGAHPYPHSVQGVSVALLNEYAAIIEKYEDKWGSIPPKERKLEEADKARLVVIYRQMNLEQQAKQIITFQYGFPLRPAVKPTAAQLMAFQNPLGYGVWVDDKKISNSELYKYKPADFGAVMISRLTDKAIDHNKYHYQVDLLTVKYNEAFRKQMKDDEFKDHMWTKMGPGKAGFKIKNDKYGVKKVVPAGKAEVEQQVQPKPFLSASGLFKELDYPNTNAGLPVDLMNEYTAIEAKYGIDEAKNSHDSKKVMGVFFNITKSDKDRLTRLYQQMSVTQQRQQNVRFQYAPSFREGTPPTAAELASYQNDRFYWVYVNDKRISNADLDRYKPEDLVRVIQKQPSPNGEVMSKYTNVIQFMTVDRYNEYRKESADKQQKSIMVLI